MIVPGDEDRIEVRDGVDTDRDGYPDTVVLPDPDDLVLAADLDRDGLADLIIEIGPDGTATSTELVAGADPGWGPTDPLADACYDPLGIERW